MSIEKVKDRIRKLLAVAADDAATQGEIDNAIAFAKSMMDNHHLSEDDLATEPEEQYSDIENAPKDRKFAFVGKKIYYWEALLGGFVQDFVGGIGCYIDHSVYLNRDAMGIMRGPPGKRVAFYGIAEDTSIAQELYTELRLTIASMARLKFGGACKGDGGTYSEGFVSGLRTKIEARKKTEKLEATASTSSRGLVLIERRNDLIERKKEAAKEYLKTECGVKLSNRRSGGGARGSGDAYNEGRSDGANSNVSADRRAKIC